MKLASKHSGVRLLQLSDFTGGINLAVPPEALAPNECQSLVNFEYDYVTGILKTRDGLEKLASLNTEIDQLYYAKNLDVLLVSSAGKLYKFNNDNTFTLLGSLSGTKIPIFTEFGNKVLIASGGNLQSYDGISLTTITTSPLCDYVNVQYGRVILSKEGQDYLYFSGVGDETNWNFSGTDADALMLQVGYKDGGNILAVKMLNKDIIVFKDNNRIYRVVGAYPGWAVYEITRKAGTLSRLSATEVGNNIAFVDWDGVKSLDTVIEYGDVKVAGLGEKINVWLKKNLNVPQIRIWHIFKKAQVWVKGQNDKVIYVFHLGSKAWSLFQFYKNVNAVAEKNNDIYVACENDLCKLSNIPLDAGQNIQCMLITKRIQPLREFLLKGGKVFYEGLLVGNAVLEVNRLNVNLDFTTTDDIAFLDNDIAYSDSDPVYVQRENVLKFRCNHRMPYFEAKVYVMSGALKLYSLNFEIAEV